MVGQKKVTNQAIVSLILSRNWSRGPLLDCSMNDQDRPRGIMKTRIKNYFVRQFPNIPTDEDKDMRAFGIVCTRLETGF